MRLDEPIHALIELKQPPHTHYVVLRRIQGEEKHIAQFFHAILKRQRKVHSAGEMLILLGSPDGPTPELLDNENALTAAQRRQCKRYVITFAPIPVMEFYPTLNASKPDYFGQLIGFVATYLDLVNDRTPSEQSRYEKKLARQRKQRAKRAAASANPAATNRTIGKLVQGDYFRPGDTSSRRYLGKAWEMARDSPIFTDQWSKTGEAFDKALLRFAAMPQSETACLAAHLRERIAPQRPTGKFAPVIRKKKR